MMTLYHLRRPSGRPPDDTKYMSNMGRQNDIQYMYVTCPMIREPLSGFLMSDIEYLIKSDRRTTSDKLYITQLLPTEYSINITNRFGRYQYNKQCMYVYDQAFRHRILDIRLNQIGRLPRTSSISLNYYPLNIQLT
jgi:hypothetical protein